MALRELASTKLVVGRDETSIPASLFLNSDSQPLNIIVGEFTVLRGSPISHRALGAPSADGSNGEKRNLIGSSFEVFGEEELKRWGAVRTGHKDAEVGVVLKGTD